MLRTLAVGLGQGNSDKRTEGRVEGGFQYTVRIYLSTIWVEELTICGLGPGTMILYDIPVIDLL